MIAVGVAWTPPPSQAASVAVAPTSHEQLFEVLLGASRWALIGTSAYLGILAGLHLIASFGRPEAPLRVLADRVTPRVLSVALTGVLLSTGALGTPVGAEPGAENQPPQMQRVTPDAQTNVADEPPTNVSSPPSSASTSAARPGDEAPRDVEPLGADPAITTIDLGPAVTERDYTVQPGDHFWNIAQAQVAARAGVDPTHHEVTEAMIAPYWLELIEENRHRLVDPDNPDLIHPGLVIVLPHG